MQICDEIKTQLYNKNGKLNAAVTRQEWFKKSQLHNDIVEATNFLDNETCIAARIYCINNNITQQPICPITNLPLSWLNNKHRFAIASGKQNGARLKTVDAHKLSAKLKASKNSIKQNFFNIYKNKEYTLVLRQECLAFIEDRLIKTNCGRLHAFINTALLKENVDVCCSILHYTQHHLLYEDIDSINWSERFYLLYHNTQPAACCYDASTKAKYCNFLKGYNASSSQQHKNKAKLKIIKNAVEQQNFSVLNDVNSHQQQEYHLKCNACGSILLRRLTNARWKDVFCAKCNNVATGTSRLEIEVANFLQQDCNLEVVNSYKGLTSSKKLEIDIFVPQKNIGIEFHGLLWHSFGSNFPNNIDEEQHNKCKHLNKRKLCMQNNIHLIQIFENEWINKQEIVKSMLRSRLNALHDRVYARNCKVIIATKMQKRDFLNANHIQGNDNSQIALALMHNEEIIAMMTFGNRKITRNKTFELIRFCCKLNTRVIGGASKLFKHFLRTYNVDKITTYADLRYCKDGSFYKSLGFKHVKTTDAAYWYTDTKTVMHRSNFQKHKLVSQGYDAKLTELQIMMQRGWRRIWDCGHMVFEYINTCNNEDQATIQAKLL